MTSATVADLRLPQLDELGSDLLITTARQRRVALARPFIGVALFALAAALRLWWIMPIIVFLIFVAVGTVTHDVVHGSLGLRRRPTGCALFFPGALALGRGPRSPTTRLHHL